ncbi:thiol reductant ABC exporter subunit CydC [Lactococcus garvieae]|uniref:Cytochrome D ABC transporter ATP-binding and permease components n=1 Tax=Lactococcus garvieae (strain Lg2) TaxID=420890 RepID=F9VF26_LACGL|nr:thiol reductant ABC exporter subunit CydC [Lactococcus garvieae]EOT32976.1 thiol reductant ABC exporter, CydC subunit [Lactococcus garvieae ATCC 49156]EOT93015.1 thiol reductant ABC exporter, CydC subunit [Lactococcus garvieae ATCC 49156]QSQ99801.1 thiol reductant ABC exporter subunit CydC [Lactococcus garvieae]BAK58959.1 cytochrome D ABC transporter ATP-binding and permease components [Lactococcus garvieae ATCC 49156]BAK60927.1 cytochrome D ABC transporter ATP-binding and permease componen
MKKILFNNDWITPFLRKYRFGMILAIILGTITMFCAGLLMFSAGYVISKSATKPENILIIYVPVLMVRVFGISRPVVRYIERLTSHNWILRITSNLRRKLYLRLEKSAIGLSERYKLGDLLGLLNEDIANIQDLFLRTLFPLMIVGSLSVALIIASGVFSIILALVVAFFLGLMVIVLPYVSLKVSAKYDRDLKNYRNQLFSNLTDDVLGLQDWVLSGRKEDFLLDYQTSEKAARQIQEKLLSYVRKRNLVLQLIFALLVVYLIVWSGSTLNVGDAPNYIAAVSLAAFPLFDAFAPLSDAVVETQRYGDSVQRLNDLPDVKEEVRQETITETDLQISNLSFAFDDKLIFDDLNLHIKKGEHVAILGRSGVGKSTLASLIRGDLIAQQGTLDLSGIAPAYANNVEEKIGVINQSPYIFNASIRSNLSLARLDASDEEIWNALELVGLKKMVASLPNQLNEVVDEAGLRFSGGERQRLALARILLSDVDMVILDEPTVSLDPITENQLLRLFFERLKDKTIIFITHHLLGVQHMDRVIFLEKGKIKLDDQPGYLLEHNEDFRKLYQMDLGTNDY